MYKSVLINGGAGFIGSHVADELAADHRVEMAAEDLKNRGLLYDS